ncbi:MAG TPA: HAD-IIA family hydrolase [Clostridiaceae bacterium]|jgi:4-nitrophenyl phosphatase|nr:HAD-IIA family hydrolase [Clostridiaceae bacterium]
MTEFKDLAYLIDMDGTIYRGSVPIPHAREFIRYLQQNRRKFLLVTNCPGNSTNALVEKVRNMGIHIGCNDIISSGDATAEFLCTSPYKRIYLIGSDALKDKLVKKGINVVTEDADCVVVGYDLSFNYKKMKEAAQFILNGAGFVCTNYDLTIPDGDRVVPHTGSIAASIEAATGVKPVYMGKPEYYLLEAVIKRLNCSRDKCCTVGDRLDTDIYFGIRQNIKSFLVLTGVTTREMLRHSKIQPTRAFENLLDILSYYSLFSIYIRCCIPAPCFSFCLETKTNLLNHYCLPIDFE